jgi:hypothetical protein
MIAVVLFMIMWQAAPEPRGSIVATRSDPPRRYFYVISYDDAFLFAGRHYGSSSDPRGNSEPGLFVHSKRHGAWIQVTAIATAGGQFGTSISNDPEA